MDLRLAVATDVPTATAWAKHLRAASGDAHPMFPEFRVYAFRGAELWGLLDKAGNPVCVNITYFGKRLTNGLGPYANVHVLYTLPSHQGQGLTTHLYRLVEVEALKRGCRRMRSLAGSAGGAATFLRLGCKFWGPTPNGELYVDSPLTGVADSREVPAKAPEPRAWSATKVRAAIKQGLRYDHRQHSWNSRLG